MITKAIITMVVAALLGTSGQIKGQAPVDWTVYLRRAGPVRIGMAVGEVRRILADPKAYLNPLSYL